MAASITKLDHYVINVDFCKFANEIIENYMAPAFFKPNVITNHS